MTRQIVLRPPSLNRRQLLLSSKSSSSGGGSVRFAEVAGGTTAECAAVCCCCPCSLVNLVVLAVYKLPAGLCRKALRKKRRRRLMKKGLLPPPSWSHRSDDTDLAGDLTPAAACSLASDQDVIALEKEMWERFYGTGFWRSPSQRDQY